MITVVEPHPDDAWLSLGATMERWIAEQRYVRILTVYADRVRAAESAAYALHIGATPISLGLTPNGGGLSGDWEAVPLPASVLSGVRSDPPGTWVWPLGIQHPEHRAVAALGRQVDPAGWSYVDLPYAMKVGRQDEVRRLLAGREIISWERPAARKWRAEAIYKSQSLFMRNNGDVLRHAPEVVVGASHG